MAEKDLNELFLDTLKDIYYAEKQILKALPKMAKAANSDKLRAAFEKHHDETEGQVERLEKIFELLGKPARGKKCDAIEGILDEGKARRRPAGGGASGRALRDFTLRHPEGLGAQAQQSASRKAARPDPGRREENRRKPDQACRDCRQL